MNEIATSCSQSAGFGMSYYFLRKRVNQSLDFDGNKEILNDSKQILIWEIRFSGAKKTMDNKATWDQMKKNYLFM